MSAVAPPLRLAGVGLANAALLLAGCADAPAAAGFPDLDAMARLTLHEELRIGHRDDPDLGFSRVGGLAVAPDGRVLVFDNASRQFRVYDPDGRRRAVFGGVGRGPGEFSGSGSIILFGIAGDTLWVNDRSAARVTFFSPGGELLGAVGTGAVMTEVPAGTMMFRPTEYLGNGLFLSSPNTSFGSSPEPIWTSLLRMDAPAERIDTLRTVLWRGGSPRSTLVGDRRVTVPQPMDDRPIYLDRLDGFIEVERSAAASPEEARVTVTHVRSPAGDTVYRRSFRYQPRAYTPARITSMMIPVMSFYRTQPEQVRVVAENTVRAAMVLPPFQPPVSEARLAADGVLWLGREGDPFLPPAEWVLIGPEGEPMGVVETPPGATLHWSRGSVVWATVLDELEVPWLVRYRLEAAR